MGKAKVLEIVLDNATGAYYAGQQITGKVRVMLKEPMRFKSLKIQFHGECGVDFVDKVNKQKIRGRDREVYFEQVDLLYGTANDNGIVELPAGQFDYPFVFQSPSHLPSSFEHNEAFVRYFAKATMQTPFLSFNQTAKRLFTIVGLADLNRSAETMKPGYKRLQVGVPNKGLFACVMMKGGIEVEVRLGRTGYVPGENILVNAEVQNASRRKIKGVHAHIQQTVTLHTRERTQKVIKNATKYAELKHGAVAPRSTQVWHDEPMNIPPLPPTNLGSCRLIGVEYELDFILDVQGMKEPIILRVPLYLGTVPLQNQAPPAWNQQQPGQNYQQPARNPSTSSTSAVPEYSVQPSAPPLAPFPEYHGPPPSYSECISMPNTLVNDSQTADTDEDDADATYRPLYPTYTLNYPVLGGSSA